LNLIAIVATWSADNTAFMNNVIILFWEMNIIIDITSIIVIYFASFLVYTIPVESCHFFV